MIFPWRGLLDVLYIGVALLMQWKLVEWVPEIFAVREPARLRRILRGFWVLSAISAAAAAILSLLLVRTTTPIRPELDWWRGLSLLWCIVSAALFAATLMLRRAPPFNPARRRLLASALLASPALVASGGALIERGSVGVTEVDMGFPGLPLDLDGLRIALLSDLHLGPFLSPEELRRVVDMTNATRPDLTVVAGDLITERDDWLSACLGALAGLRADAGVFGCMGNHEGSARCRRRAKKEGAALGLDFLRQETRTLEFGSATLNLAGVDHQYRSRPYLRGAESLLRLSSFNLLLSHNPDVFPTAARQGWDLTLSGHTHGGQITLGILRQHVNLARMFTPYIYGAYRRESSAIYVTRGIGTVGVPARIGAPPEIAVIRLCVI